MSWLRDAKEFRNLVLLKPDIVKPYQTQNANLTSHPGLLQHALRLYNRLQESGGGAKVTTGCLDCRFPIDENKRGQYPRMTPAERWGGVHEVFHFGNDITIYETILQKTAVGERFYLQLPAMKMPEGAEELVHACNEHFRPHFKSKFQESRLVSISARLYHVNDHNKEAEPLAVQNEHHDTGRAKMVHELVVLKRMIEKLEENRRNLRELSMKLETFLERQLVPFRVDATNDSGLDSGSDDDEDEKGARKKQRTARNKGGKKKRIEEILCDIHTITVKKGKGLDDVRDMRKKDFDGDSEPHVLELMGAIFAGNTVDMPMAVAPKYSSGAELEYKDGHHRFRAPADELEQDSIMVQKMELEENEETMEMMRNYCKAHDDALELCNDTKAIMQTLREKFTMYLCLQGPGGEIMGEVNVVKLTILQKAAFCNVFMANITRPAEAEGEEEGEEEEEEGEEEDEGDEEYEDKGCSDEEDEDEEDEEDYEDESDDSGSM